MIYGLIIGLLFVLWISFVANRKDMMTPSFLFTGPFVIACICAAAYADKWSLDLHLNTFLVIFLGCMEFTVVCFIVHASYGKQVNRKIIANPHKYKSDEKTVYNVESWKIIVLILFQAVSAFVVVKGMRSALSQYGVGSGSLTSLMYYFREYSMYTDNDVLLPSLASNMRTISIAATYVVMYIVINNIICKAPAQKLVLLFISGGLGILNSVLLGARGEAIQLLVGAIIIYFLLMRKYNGWKPKIKFRTILFLGLILLFVMLTFKSVGNILGRGEASYAKTMTVSAVDEVAKYLGAEIKNLDIFLQEDTSNNGQIFGSQTFGNSLSWISTRLGLGWNIVYDFPFRRVNGISLGNVYTIFYTLIYDFGYIGEFILIPLVALFTQMAYEAVPIEQPHKISFRIVLYSYIGALLTFSFFGGRIFTYVLNISFVKYLLVWYLQIWCFTKLKIKIN